MAGEFDGLDRLVLARIDAIPSPTFEQLFVNAEIALEIQRIAGGRDPQRILDRQLQKLRKRKAIVFKNGRWHRDGAYPATIAR